MDSFVLTTSLVNKYEYNEYENSEYVYNFDIELIPLIHVHNFRKIIIILGPPLTFFSSTSAYFLNGNT